MSLMQFSPNYFYQIYSEKIQTDFQVPYLKSGISEKKNLTFKASSKIKNCSNKNFFNLNLNKGIYCKKDQLKASVDSNIRYQILNKKISNTDLSFKLFTHPMGLYLFQKGNFVLHSSAINIDGKGFIFMGLSGAGKSSAVASLINQGELITEDISKINFDGDSAFISPSLPIIKLSKDIFNFHTFETIGDFDIAGDQRNRKGYVVKNFDQTNAPVKVSGCFILNGENSKEIQKVDADFAFRNLLMNSFSAIPKNECRESEKMLLDKISSFIGKVPIYNLPRQKNFSNKLILDFISKC